MSKTYANQAVTPAAVDSCRRVSHWPEYIDAFALLPSFAARCGDADEVVSIAAVLLGALVESGHAPADAAKLAVKRASQRAAVVARDSDSAPDVPAGDWQSLDTLSSAATYGATDRCAVVRDIDVLTTVKSLMAQSGASADDVAALTLRTKSERKSAAERAQQRAYARSLKMAQAVVPDLLEQVGAIPSGPGAAAVMCGGSVPLPTSGPASFVVQTAPDGSPWLMLPNAAHLISHAAAARFLAYPHALAADGSGTRREVDSAMLMASTDATTRGAARHQGVTTGIVYGVGATIAGTGAPTPKPSAPRKRARDGAIGASMIPA